MKKIKVNFKAEKNVMAIAWEIRTAAAIKWNCERSEIVFGICLRMAWAGQTIKMEETMEELHTKIAEYDKTNNDGYNDGYNPYRDQLIAKQNKLINAKDMTWTKEVTIARRQEWKKWVLSNAKNGKISAEKLNEKTIEQGWNLEALKNAVKKHNL